MEKTTDKLNSVLQKTHPEDLGNYFFEHKTNNIYAFSDYMDQLFEKYNLKKHDIFIIADIPDRYGYKILSQQKHTVKRDVIIRICLAMHLHLDELNRCLTLYGTNGLYPKNNRDALLISCISNNIFQINKINELLQAYNLAKLDDCGNQ